MIKPEQTVTIKPEQTVASVVRKNSECAEIFQKYHIDYCCRGNMSLKEAAEKNNVNLSILIQELVEVILNRNSSPVNDPANLSTPALISHIILIHHEFLRKALPLVVKLSAKVSGKHGQRDLNLVELDRTVQNLANHLLPHLDKEEKSLFPAVLSGNIDKKIIDKLFLEMILEHEEVADMLFSINKLTNDFVPPDNACNSYRTLFSELKYIENDTFRHVYLENHILKPRCSEI